MKYPFSGPGSIRLLLLQFLILISVSYAQFNEMKELSFINSCGSAQPLSQSNGEMILFYVTDNAGMDSLLFTRSSDYGITWQNPELIMTFPNLLHTERINISAAYDGLNNYAVLYSIFDEKQGGATAPAQLIFSSDNGKSWSQPQGVLNLRTPEPVIRYFAGYFYVAGRPGYIHQTGNYGQTWINIKTGFKADDLVVFDSDSLLAVYIVNSKLAFRSSSDSGKTWSQDQLPFSDEYPASRPRLIRSGNGNIFLAYEMVKNAGTVKQQSDVVYRKSTDNGLSWDSPVQFTLYPGDDLGVNITGYSETNAFLVYRSLRWNGKKLLAGVSDLSIEPATPPVLFKYHPSSVDAGIPITLFVTAADEKGIASVNVDVKLNGAPFGTFSLDSIGNDIYSCVLGTFTNLSFIEYTLFLKDVDGIEISYDLELFVQSETAKSNWLNTGSLHNWYTSIGCEYEQGLQLQQQFGMSWPGIYPNQDIQVAKGLWIGTKDFVDETGQSGSNNFYPYKVVHVGPRVDGSGEFFPQRFDLTSKYAPTEVYVNGLRSTLDPSIVNVIDPQIDADREIINTVNTQTGITMTRRIKQWSQELHDNYHLVEYTFKNTGNVDADPSIELPAKVLDSVYFYFQYRLAINANTRYQIGNGTGWGMNTMIDTRGDGRLDADNPDNMRLQYVWHGPFPPFTDYDNLGGPLWVKTVNVEAQDTIGRFAAPQFAGMVTIHADKSPSDKTDDPMQPSTTSWEGSDEPLTTGNSAFNPEKMKSEFQWMKRGHKYPRHAEAVDPDGNYATANGDPALKTPGGFTVANGYGPYHLEPGDSITIVLAEAVAGLSREKCIEYGREYKQEYIAAGGDMTKRDAANLKKNLRVMSGKDSLFQTFRRAIANYKSGYNISLPPAPPQKFNLRAEGASIVMDWEIESDNKLKGFEIWRAEGRYDTVYSKIFETADINVRSYTDSAAAAGETYYYYLLSVSDEIAADPSLGIPKKKLTSSRYYTQTYDPVYIITDVNDDVSLYKYELMQNYPNPFNPATTIEFTIPSRQHVVLRIYNTLGELTETIVNTELNAGSHKFTWKAKDIATGIYIYTLTTDSFRSSKKLILMK